MKPAKHRRLNTRSSHMIRISRTVHRAMGGLAWLSKDIACDGHASNCLRKTSTNTIYHPITPVDHCYTINVASVTTAQRNFPHHSAPTSITNMCQTTTVEQPPSSTTKHVQNGEMTTKRCALAMQQYPIVNNHVIFSTLQLYSHAVYCLQRWLHYKKKLLPPLFSPLWLTSRVICQF